MVTLQIPDELESLIALGMKRTGETRDVFLRKAIRLHLEDLQDVAAAREHLLHPDDTITLDELKKNAGLND
jgi:predicted DNA-binding protein